MFKKVAIRRGNRGTAFTLVELLVVISIIALLIAILLPSLRRARDQAKDVVCKSNLKQLGLTVAYYTEDHNGRLPWIRGTANGPLDPTESLSSQLTNAPFHQYEQLIRFRKYLKQLELFICPQAKSPGIDGWPNGPRGPKTVTRYEFGTGTPNHISYYVMLNTSNLFKPSDFPEIQDPYAPQRDNYIEELYTEYWFNDWQSGATESGTGAEIPPISGGRIDRIPFPEYAVVMADATAWNPRHHGGNHFMFLDTHVDWHKQDNYFDVKSEQRADRDDPDFEPRDTDPFGNQPYWAWGLGKKIRGY